MHRLVVDFYPSQFEGGNDHGLLETFVNDDQEVRPLLKKESVCDALRRHRQLTLTTRVDKSVSPSVAEQEKIR